MEDETNAKIIASIIIKRTTGRVIKNFTIETQKELKGIDRDKRGIRMDVLVSVSDEIGKVSEVYDIEPNDYYEPDIAKRTRYYNALTDVKLLTSNAEFHRLPELISIWILPYDPFGDNRMLYTVKNVVVENNKLVYNDGVTNLFLNTKGTVGGSEELRTLLKHMENTTKENAVDDDLKQIQKIIDAIKQNKKVGERYMSLEKMLKSAEVQGYDAGREDGIRILVESLYESSMDKLSIKKMIVSKYDISEDKAAEYISQHIKK